MFGQIHVSALHRVLVNVVQLLPHHRFTADQFRMGAFLPELVFPVPLVRLFGQPQPVQQPLRPTRLQQFDEPAGRVGFETAQALVQTRGLGHEVQVVFQDDVAEKSQAVVRPLMRPTVQDDPHRLRPGEHGQPLHHGAGQKMGFVRLQDDVTASGHALALSTGTLERPDGVPTLERGNDQNEKLTGERQRVRVKRFVI